eukprot:g69078.t1
MCFCPYLKLCCSLYVTMWCQIAASSSLFLVQLDYHTQMLILRAVQVFGVGWSPLRPVEARLPCYIDMMQKFKEKTQQAGVPLARSPLCQMSLLELGMLLVPLLAAQAVANYPCEATIDNVYFDYRPLQRTAGSYYNGKDSSGQDYELNLCGIIEDGGTCQRSGAAICQVAGDSSVIVVASATDARQPTYSSIDSSDVAKGLKLSFDNEPLNPPFPCYPLGTVRRATVQLTCVPGASPPTTPLVVAEPSTCNYLISIPSKYGCPAPKGGWKVEGDVKVLSAGSVILILLFPVICLYLLLGILYKSKVQGTSGVESIPNIDFWRQVPELVKDGIIFTMRGCKKPGGAGTGYDEL